MHFLLLIFSCLSFSLSALDEPLPPENFRATFEMAYIQTGLKAKWVWGWEEKMRTLEEQAEKLNFSKGDIKNMKMAAFKTWQDWKLSFQEDYKKAFHDRGNKEGWRWEALSDEFGFRAAFCTRASMTPCENKRSPAWDKFSANRSLSTTNPSMMPDKRESAKSTRLVETGPMILSTEE